MEDRKSLSKVIIITETPIESWLRDASTFALFVGLIGIGVYLESAAMQWVGALIGFTLIVAKSLTASGRRHFTIAEARAELDRIEERYGS